MLTKMDDPAGLVYLSVGKRSRIDSRTRMKKDTQHVQGRGNGGGRCRGVRALFEMEPLSED